MANDFRRFIEDESGATAVEYSLIAALITLAGVAALKGFGIAFSQVFTTIDVVMGG